MVPKTSAYVGRYEGRPKEMYLLIGDDDLLEKLILLGLKLLLISKTNLNASLSIMKNF